MHLFIKWFVSYYVYEDYYRNMSCALNLISTFLFRYVVFGNLYMYLYFNVFICLNRSKLFPHFIYYIFIPKNVKIVLKLLVCHYNLFML